MRRFDTCDVDFETRFAAFLDEPRGSPADVDAAAAAIIEGVRSGGLSALLDYVRRFDKVELTEDTIRVSDAEIQAGVAACPKDVRDAIAFAAKRIETYHRRQRPDDARWIDEAGVELGWRWTPIEAVGVYVPGGRAAYPSTVLMNAMPAKVAGVDRIAMVHSARAAGARRAGRGERGGGH